MRIRQYLPQPYMCHVGPLDGAVAGSCSLVIVNQYQCEGCCWLQRDIEGMGWGWGTVMENAGGGKPGSHGSKVILLSHT